MRELPFYYNHQTNKITQSKPEYSFKIAKKSDEFIDVYSKEVVMDSNTGFFKRKDKYITSFSKNDNIDWTNLLNNMCLVFYAIRTYITSNEKYCKTTRIHTNFFNNDNEKYVVLSYDGFKELINNLPNINNVVDNNVICSLLSYVSTSWVYQFLKELPFDMDLRKFLNIPNEKTFIPLLNFIVDNQFVWIEIPNESKHNEDYTNVYRYFKSNKIKNINPRKYDEVFEFDMRLSNSNYLETPTGDASHIAFMGFGRCILETDKESYSVIKGHDMVDRYLEFVKTNLNKTIDKIYCMPIKTNVKEVYSIAFRYKKSK